tara:strand:+ start:137 stop:631 length:495 start_codon:yes stop_codon:yes gene_type:complete
MNKIYTPTPNGRIDIINSDFKSYPFFLEKNSNYTFDKNAVSNRYEYNNLQSMYFSQKNINFLQLEIRKIVHKRTKHGIHNQDSKVLKTIMKSIFLQYGKNLETDLVGQVNMLNKFVLNYSVNNIISNIELYLTYRKSISYIPIPLSNPTYVSSAGTKTNKNFIY